MWKGDWGHRQHWPHSFWAPRMVKLCMAIYVIWAEPLGRFLFMVVSFYKFYYQTPSSTRLSKTPLRFKLSHLRLTVQKHQKSWKKCKAQRNQQRGRVRPMFTESVAAFLHSFVANGCTKPLMCQHLPLQQLAGGPGVRLASLEAAPMPPCWLPAVLKKAALHARNALQFV